MEGSSLKLLGAGIAMVGSLGAGIGLGLIFASWISAIARNPSAEAKFRQIGEKCVADGKPGVEVVTYQDKPSGMRMLQTDRADVLMSDSGGIGQAIAMQPNEFERAFTIKTDFKVGPGFSKTQTVLRDAVFEAIKLLQADGTQASLMEKYHVDPSLQLPVEMFTQ